MHGRGAGSCPHASGRGYLSPRPGATPPARQLPTIRRLSYESPVRRLKVDFNRLKSTSMACECPVPVPSVLWRAIFVTKAEIRATSCCNALDKCRLSVKLASTLGVLVPVLVRFPPLARTKVPTIFLFLWGESMRQSTLLAIGLGLISSLLGVFLLAPQTSGKDIRDKDPHVFKVIVIGGTEATDGNSQVGIDVWDGANAFVATYKPDFDLVSVNDSNVESTAYTEAGQLALDPRVLGVNWALNFRNYAIRRGAIL
jgi:hypothetical protein